MIALLTAVVGLASCAGEGPSSEVIVRDSAGIRVVENHGTAGVEASWRITAEPLFRVGWGEEDPLFESVADGIVLEDGRVAVADAGSQWIHLISSSGQALSMFGGPGDGPGEFRNLHSIVHAQADTLWVQEASLAGVRLSTVTASTFLGAKRAPSRVSGGFYGLLGRTSDGGYAAWSTLGYMGRPGGFPQGWLTFPVINWDAELTTFDTLAQPGMVFVAGPDDRNPIGPGGSVTLADDLLAYGTGDRPEVTWVDANGVVRQVARWDATPGEPTDAHWRVYERWYRSVWAQRYDEEELRERLAQRRRALRGPLPLFGSLHGDEGGNIWLEEYVPGGPDAAVRRLSVLARDGRWLGTVELPRAARPLDITEALFLAVEYDEFDVQAVVLYRIEKPNQ